MIIHYIHPTINIVDTIEITPVVKEPNIDDGLVTAYCYIVDPEGMDDKGNYAHDFTFQVWRTEDDEEHGLLGFVVGCPFFPEVHMFVEDSMETIYLMRKWHEEAP